ncbi:hypothetical protein [Jatrophihabitans sp.]|uniref:hypothetical protein n=1 Tax=Jatrophihabitans sp. TaxID=1932789 RepID=UPI002D0D082F|nr:hypothetical protein [Jatrophihabitans sp.]
MTAAADPTLVDGVDIDAVAAAVRGCPAVDDLDGGLLGGAVTYLPGRRVPGIRIAEGRIEVHVRGVWDQPVDVVAGQVRQALAPLAAGHVVDVVLSDIAEPDWAKPEPADPAVPADPAAGAGSPTVLADGTVEPWTTSAFAEPSGASSSASTTPTAAETRPSS